MKMEEPAVLLEKKVMVYKHELSEIPVIRSIIMFNP